MLQEPQLKSVDRSNRTAITNSNSSTRLFKLEAAHLQPPQRRLGLRITAPQRNRIVEVA